MYKRRGAMMICPPSVGSFCFSFIIIFWKKKKKEENLNHSENVMRLMEKSAQSLGFELDKRNFKKCLIRKHVKIMKGEEFLPA